jgi:molybdopterin adenylyltransferase
VNAAVLTVSDGVFHGEREDESGDVLAAEAEGAGFTVVARAVVADEVDAIAGQVLEWCDDAPLLDVALLLVTGGTGFAPRDVTPEATASVIERQAPGIAEAIRSDALERTPHALLSRGLAGLKGATLVVNLPGSPGGCRDGFAVLQPALRHGLELAAGDRSTAHRQT